MYFTGLLWAVGELVEHLTQPLYIEKPHDISCLIWQFTCPFNHHNKPKVSVGHFLHFENMKTGLREVGRLSLDDSRSQEWLCWKFRPRSVHHQSLSCLPALWFLCASRLKKLRDLIKSCPSSSVILCHVGGRWRQSSLKKHVVSLILFYGKKKHM